MEDYLRVISYCEDLDGVLRDKRDSNSFAKCLEDMKVLRSSCHSDLANINAALQDYESKIEACKHKTEAVKAEVVSDKELERLRKELEEEHNKESLLSEELRVIAADIADLEQARGLVQERKRATKKLEQDELSAQKTLSMLALVTDIIPELSDPSNVSGHIIDRDKKAVKKFEFDSTRMTEFDTCNNIWKMIGP